MPDMPERIANALGEQPTAEAVAMLLHNLADSGRLGAQQLVAGPAPDSHWPALEETVMRLITNRASCSISEFRAHENAIIPVAWAALWQADDGETHCQTYGRFLEDLAGWIGSWTVLAAEQTLAQHLHAAFLWHTVKHLLEAGIALPNVVRMVSGEPVEEPTRHAPVPEPVKPGLQHHLARTVALTRTGSAYASTLALRAGSAAWAQARKAAATFAKSRAQAARRAQEAAEERRRQLARRQAEWEAHRAALDAASAEPGMSIAGSGLQINGRALRRSVFPVWLLLVVLSLVALVWGSLLMLPVVGPIGSAVFLTLGVVVVPIWGTLFGFLGMGNARDNTLRQMGFHPLPKGHPLQATGEAYCRQLDIPVPRLGTVDAFNAFAMGIDEHNATVVLGRPLLARLTPEESAAVLAHELAHVVGGDMRRMMLMRTFQNATVWFMLTQGAKQFVRWIICWTAELAILAFSRRREFRADAIGAVLAGKHAMIGALRKLEKAPPPSRAERRHARFMISSTLATHPSTAQRVWALQRDVYIRHVPVRMT